MFTSHLPTQLRHVAVATRLLLDMLVALVPLKSAQAAGCAFAAQGEGPVAEIIRR
jgi:hypothetical protein